MASKTHVSSLKISLTIFYSTFSKLFLLLLLVMIDPQPIPIPSKLGKSAAVNVPHDFLSYATFISHDLKVVIYKLFTAFTDERIDRPWIVNTLVGGMSAGFGLRGTSSFNN